MPALIADLRSKKRSQFNASTISTVLTVNNPAAEPVSPSITQYHMNSKEQLTARAQLVRIHEANCHIEYPTPVEANFRIAIMKQLGREFALRELRPANIAGPVPTTPQRPPAPKRSCN